ncbi:DUF4251 domain-containing protein [Aquimarina sp. AU474]|uniref:DUF4251 domain-containing protein n=1 Tax=Aquimarina sp. AU474 TaxID=2108529 RepID=UPI000D69F978|nr:DUF4251 domain-containing protein [Aquimarina sp. AU474]
MKIRIFLFGLGLLLISCSSSKDIVAPTEKSRALDALVKEKAFQIDLNWAYPLATGTLNRIANSGLLPPGSTASSISLIGNSNYFKMHGDSITMDLPYYGERQLAGDYDTSKNGIKFKGVPENFEIQKNEKKQSYEMSFFIKNDRESSRVIITLFPNHIANININSSHRTPIRYKGDMKPLSNDNRTRITQQ